MAAWGAGIRTGIAPGSLRASRWATARYKIRLAIPHEKRILAEVCAAFSQKVIMKKAPFISSSLKSQRQQQLQPLKKLIKALQIVALSLAALGIPASVRADTIYVARSGGEVLKFNSSGAGSQFISENIDVPYGLAFDSSGNLYVANNFASTILKYNSSGVGTVFASGLNNPRGLAFDSSGNLYVANNGANTILKYNSSGVGTVFASGLDFPICVALDGSGNLYVGETGSLSHDILEYNSSGARTVFASGLGPTGLAFDSSGNLYAANAEDDTILKLNSTGARTVFASGLGTPYGLAFDSSGNLYVADYPNYSVMKYDTSGVGSVFVAGLGANGRGPIAIAIIPEPRYIAFMLLAVACGPQAIRALRRRKQLA